MGWKERRKDLFNSTGRRNPGGEKTRSASKHLPLRIICESESSLCQNVIVLFHPFLRRSAEVNDTNAARVSTWHRSRIPYNWKLSRDSPSEEHYSVQQFA